MEPNFTPSEEEFELLLAALNAYEKEAVTLFLVNQYLKKVENLNDEQAFVKAFSGKPDDVAQTELVAKTKEVRDKVVLVAAKLVQMRDHIRGKRLLRDIDSLIA